MSDEACPQVHIAARSILKRRYGALFAGVTRILYEEDPMFLASGGAPRDEYEIEAGTIIPRLREAQSQGDAERIIEEEFERWFSTRIDAGAAAARIWRLWEGEAPPLPA